MKEERTIWTAVRQVNAVLWLVLLLTASDSVVVWRWFARWQARSPENRAEFLRVESLWGAIRMLRRSSVWHEGSGTTGRVERSTARGLLLNIGIAAVVAVCVAGVGWYICETGVKREKAQQFAAEKFREVQGERRAHGTFATTAGHQKDIWLTDESEVLLHANSSITLNITKEERWVSLEKGTALFKVSKDTKNRPFDVVVGDSKVRAVGTIFSVTRKSAQVAETVVSQGAVEIYSKDAEIGRVGAGETATVKEGNLQRQKPLPSKIDARLAWTTGQIEFQGESLAEAVAVVNSYNKRQIAIVDAATGAMLVGGTFPEDDPDAFAALVSNLLRLNHSLDPVGSNGAGTIYLKAAHSQTSSVPSTGSEVVDNQE